MTSICEKDGWMMKQATTLLLVLGALVLFLLSGCGLFRSGAETLAPPTATTRPTAIGTPPGISAATVGTPVATSTPEGPVTLVLWASEGYAPNSETGGGMRLLEQIQAFKQSASVQPPIRWAKVSPGATEPLAL